MTTKDFPTQVFDTEACPKCGTDGIPQQSNIGTFKWVCPNCYETWKPSMGTVMDMFNDIHFEYLPDLYDD